MWKGTQVPFHIHGEVHRSVACDTSFSEEAAIIFKMPEMDEENLDNDMVERAPQVKYVIEPQSEAAKRREGIAMRERLVERFD